MKINFTHQQLKALSEACGFRSAGTTDDLTRYEYAALQHAWRKILDRLMHPA